MQRWESAPRFACTLHQSGMVAVGNPAAAGSLQQQQCLSLPCCFAESGFAVLACKHPRKPVGGRWEMPLCTYLLCLAGMPVVLSRRLLMVYGS